MPSEHNSRLEREIRDLGFEFADLGDEWGFRARFWVEDSPSGWPTKAEALAALKTYLNHTRAA